MAKPPRKGTTKRPGSPKAPTRRSPTPGRVPRGGTRPAVRRRAAREAGGGRPRPGPPPAPGARRRPGRGPPGRARAAAGRPAPASARSGCSPSTTRPTCSTTSSSWPRPSGCRCGRSAGASSTPRPAPRRRRACWPRPRRWSRRRSTTWPAAEPAPPFLVAVDGVTDPGNLGALLRSAECAGVTGVVLPRHRAVHVTPTVTKAAAGAIEHLPIAVVGGLPTALQQLSSAACGWSASTATRSTGLWDLPAADGPIALVLGAEGTGLSRLVRQRCDEVVRIPLPGCWARSTWAPPARWPASRSPAPAPRTRAAPLAPTTRTD